MTVTESRHCKAVLAVKVGYLPLSVSTGTYSGYLWYLSEAFRYGKR